MTLEEVGGKKFDYVQSGTPSPVEEGEVWLDISNESALQVKVFPVYEDYHFLQTGHVCTLLTITLQLYTNTSLVQ